MFKDLRFRSYLIQKLNTIYSIEEAISITDIFLEYLSESSTINIDKLTKLSTVLNSTEFACIQNAISRLLNYEPIQYIVGYQYFFNLKIGVIKSVLIPRPETEELVLNVINYYKNTPIKNLIDFCTGSACIALTLKNKLKVDNVYAVDVSEPALAVALSNSNKLKIDINIIKDDVLHLDFKPTQKINCIISNPPYIPHSQYVQLEKNVLHHEPKLALAVSDYDPLIFYKRIIEFACQYLETSGSLLFEIHNDFAIEMLQLFDSTFFESKILPDMYGNLRFIFAKKIK